MPKRTQHEQKQENLLFNVIKTKGLATVEDMIQDGVNVNSKNTHGNSPLFVAIKKKANHLIINALLKAGANVNFATKQNRTPLHIAAERGDVEIIDALLKKGAKIDAVSAKGNTALHLAIKNNNFDVVRALLKKGASLTIANNNGETPQSMLQKLEAPKKTIDINAQNSEGNTALHLATQKISDINAENAKGCTQLHVAVSKGQVEKVLALIQQGADVNYLTSKNLNSPLILAVKNGNPEIVKALIAAGANVKHANINGTSSVSLATKKGNVEIVNMLIGPRPASLPMKPLTETAGNKRMQNNPSMMPKENNPTPPSRYPSRRL